VNRAFFFNCDINCFCDIFPPDDDRLRFLRFAEDERFLRDFEPDPLFRFLYEFLRFEDERFLIDPPELERLDDFDRDLDRDLENRREKRPPRGPGPEAVRSPDDENLSKYSPVLSIDLFKNGSISCDNSCLIVSPPYETAF
jgi:hypothetical protein